MAIAEIEAAQDALSATPAASRPKRAPVNKNLGHLPEHLPRVERVIEPDCHDCPHGCGRMHRIGEDRTERIDIVPVQVRAVVTFRPKYACRVCSDGVTPGGPLCGIGSRTMASAPAYLIEGGLPTEGTLAYVLVSKYADHRPLL